MHQNNSGRKHKKLVMMEPLGRKTEYTHTGQVEEDFFFTMYSLVWFRFYS